jgi:hypothetical protein
MPRGDKSSYSSKQKRQAEHIEQVYEKKGASAKTAESRAWATVNRQDGGAKKPARAKKAATKKTTAKKTAAKKSSTRKTTAASGTKKRPTRSAATKRAH